MWVLLSVLAIASIAVQAQYNDGQYNSGQYNSGQYNSGQYNHGQYNHQQNSAPSYNSNAIPQSSGRNSAAPVHYVNIGAQLQGDYKFGYEADNGAFREETRLPDGTVMGQYGYTDANGQKRIVKYRAGKEGFQAEGDGIEKPAPPQAPQAAPSHNSYNHQAPPQNYNNYNVQPPQQNYNHQAPSYYNHQPQNNNQYSVQAPQGQYNGYPFTYITHENQPQQRG